MNGGGVRAVIRARTLLDVVAVAYAAVAVLAAAAPALAQKPPYEVRKIDTEDGVRSFLLEIAGEADGPRPAMVVLHGGGGKAEQVREHAGFTLLDKGWAMIYPRGRDRGWNDGRTGVDGMALREEDDVGFLRQIVATLAEEGVINPTKVFFAGISNGGMMAFRMSCDAPEIVAGTAIVAATQPVGLYCENLTPAPTIYFHGTEDKFVPYDGGRVAPQFRADRGQSHSVLHSLQISAHRNGCRGYRDLPTRDADPDDGTALVLRVYDGCAAPLLHYIIEGGGHTWPGAEEPRPLLAKLVGRTSREVDATEEIERLFESLAAR